MLVLAGCNFQKKGSKNPETLILATTTSTQDTGLLDVLIPKFEKKYHVKVKVIAVGTGEALKMGMRGDADVLLVHSREDEEKFMANSYGEVRKDVMHNFFIIVGPPTDPAQIKKAKTAKEAFRRIAREKALFASRADNSGTHRKEMKIWEEARIKPSGLWYIQTGQGMAETLKIASEKGAYTLTDKGTYLATRAGTGLKILLGESEDLKNAYSVIVVNARKFPKVHRKLAQDFVNFITGIEGQAIIKDFGKDKFSEPLFIQDAIK